jgi:acid phosphatase (class A)
MSAVEAGRLNGSIVVAGLHGSAGFRADMEAARKEAVRLRKSGKAPDPAACAAETAALRQEIYN